MTARYAEHFHWYSVSHTNQLYQQSSRLHQTYSFESMVKLRIGTTPPIVDKLSAFPNFCSVLTTPGKMLDVSCIIVHMSGYRMRRLRFSKRNTYNYYLVLFYGFIISSYIWIYYKYWTNSGRTISSPRKDETSQETTLSSLLSNQHLQPST